MTLSTREAGRDWRQLIGDILIAAFWMYFAWRFLSAFIAHYRPQDGLLLLLESFTAAVFLTRRRAKTSSSDLGDWVIALFGTMAPLCFQPGPAALLLPVRLVLQTVQAFGTCVSMFGLLWLNRSFGIVPANRGIRAGGLYRFVRHPIYAGYILAQIAYTAANPTGRNIAVFAAGTILQVLRIANEENHLKQDPEYRGYLARTRWRLCPFLY
jgi:protein-S-isoprenylcysteine O-methyltransferase Ste14